MNKTIFSCVLMNAFELYEFTLCAYFAPVIGALFFPSSDPMMSFLWVLSIFASGSIARILGAFIWGHIGDRYGRNRALMASAFFMVIPTTLIGFLPTYHHIGIWAGILLACLRMMQGISIGGEFGGILVFLFETSPTPNKILSLRWLSLSSALGIVFGFCSAHLIESIWTLEEMMHGFWRFPFILSAFSVLLVLYMRKKIFPTTESLQVDRDKPTPFLELMRHHRSTFIRLLICNATMVIHFYLLAIYFKIYFVQTWNQNESFLWSIAGFTGMGITSILTPKITDIWGDRRTLIMGIALLGFISIPCIEQIIQCHHYWSGISFCILCIVQGLIMPCILSIVGKHFPPSVRYSGASLTHGLAASLFGGTAPWAMGVLSEVYHCRLAAGYYLAFFCGLALIAMLTLKPKA